MRLFSWLTRLARGQWQTRGVPVRKPAPRFRPQLEVLEGRLVPSTLTVTNTNDSGAGSLRAEIAAAKSGDTITFAPSLNGQTITLTSGELLINKGLTIQGPGATQLTISGNNTSREFEVNATQPVVLSGLTLTGGSGGTDGGGIYNHTALTVNDCHIFSNKASYGGGIFSSGTLTVNDSVLAGDTASSSGGGIYANHTLALSDCTLDEDRAGIGDGGGIWCGYFSTLTASGCTLYDNFAGESGGGMWLGGTAALTNCTLAYNQANGNGSASWGNPPPPVGGGGIYLFGSSRTNLTLINCTVSTNYAYYDGGSGIEVAPRAILNLVNTIVSGNTSSVGGFESDINGAVATSDHSYVGAGAQLGPLQDNGGSTWTMALLPGSPAIGSADNSKAPATDQRGVTRQDVPGETTDIGAFEA